MSGLRTSPLSLGTIRAPIAFLFALILLTHAHSAFAAGTWQERYEAAKRALIAGEDEKAAAELETLAAEAPTPDERRVALELADVARARQKPRPPAPAPQLRSNDEISILYTSAFVYGLGTSAWIVLLTKPENFAGAVLPFAGITASAVVGVAVADGYRPFRRGVPHAITAGLYLGAGQGLWVVGFQRAGAARRDDGSGWESAEVATALWAGATLGGVAGGLVGAWREPTPGRVSFTASAAIWSGLVFSFAGAALDPNDRTRGEVAFATGGIAYDVGILTGIITAPRITPSVARMRFVDLGGIGGGLLGAGVYAIAAESTANPRAGLASAAAGSVSGLALTWWLTRNMPKDPEDLPRTATLRPLFAPTRGGFIAGVSGEL